MKFYVGPYPVYTFDSTLELADQTLSIVKNLDFQSIKNSQDEKLVSLGYTGQHEKLFHKELYDWFYDCLEKIELIHLIGLKLKIVDIWGVRAKFGESSVNHAHNNSMFSGVYHLSDCKRSELVFSYQDQFYENWKFVLSDNIKVNTITVPVNPKKGRLYIWPSNLLHKINPHTEMDNRYSLAFNTFFEMNESFETKKLVLRCT